MRKFAMTIALAVLPLTAFALDPAPDAEIRIGWGDPMFESAVFYNNSQKTRYSYTGHFFTEFSHSVNACLNFGFHADVEGVYWTAAKTGKRENYHNIGLFPTFRFTYFRKGSVTMYSGIGLGVNINTGSEIDYKGRRTVFAPLLNITTYAVSVNFSPHWFGTFELGGLNSLNGKHEIFMVGSRLMSISFGYRL